MGPVVKLLSSGLGLASEAIAARKASKAEKLSRANSGNPDPTRLGENDVVEVADPETALDWISQGHAVPVNEGAQDNPFRNAEIVDDDADWELDEAGQEHSTDSGAGEEESTLDVRKITREFLAKYPPPVTSLAGAAPLPCPVIIPQRRPRSKDRGFVRAYAPVLEDCGIDQHTFLDFLEVFQKASQASSVFKVVFATGAILGNVPSVVAMTSSFVIQVIAGAAIVGQSRSRTNTFLDDLNEHFFRPRGLYAMLMSYKPGRHDWSSAAMDISQTLAKSIPADDETFASKTKHNLQYSSGKSHGEEEMPIAAPLIYPDLDAAAASDAPTGMKAKWQKSNAFIGDYFDRRAQATYAAENPESSLNVPQKQEFASRFSDPNHPANSGRLISLLTGGHIDPKSMRQQRIDKVNQKVGFKTPLGMLRQRPVKRALRLNVLYLMIVNYPSEEELARARADLEKAQKKD